MANKPTKEERNINNTTLRIRPINDQVLIKAHKLNQSELEIDDPNHAPSGVVLAVGRGTIYDGKLFPPQVEVGDSVAFVPDARFTQQVPLAPGKEDLFLLIPESLILGVLGELTDDSFWHESKTWRKPAKERLKRMMDPNVQLIRN